MNTPCLIPLLNLFDFNVASTGALYNIFSGWRKMLVGVLVGGGLR